MRTLKKDWWKVILIIIVGGFLNAALHKLLSPITESNISVYKPSILVKNGMVMYGVIVWELLAFSMLTLSFILIQKNLPGKKWEKGLLYGICFGGLYFIGMFEPVLLVDSPVLNELSMGATDFISFTLAATLLGIFIGTDETQDRKRRNVLPVFVIAIFYLVGRYFAYSVLHIGSAYISKPLGTLIFTLCLGLWVGVIYFILQPGIKGKSIISQSLFFGIVIFGSNWLLNHVFMFVVTEFSLDFFIRIGSDIVFTSLGLYVYKKLKGDV